MKIICLDYDVWDDNGLFINSKTIKENNLRYFTRAALLWSDINKRCNNSSGKNPTYKEVVNNFLDFQDFANWANSQYGYLNKDLGGRSWVLDKDILLENCKMYSPETCLFVPRSINAIFVSNKRRKKKYELLGVSEDHSKIRANCRYHDGTKSVNKFLGYFDTAEEAHRAWQKAKSGAILKAAKDVTDHRKLYHALVARAERLMYQHSRGEVTLWG